MWKTWNVTEDNGGGLTLNVWDKGGSLVYIHSGYEYNPGQLSNDIASLYDENNDMDDWEGNEVDVCDYDGHPTTQVIVSGNEDSYRINVCKMGAAGKKEFVSRED